VFDDLGFSVAEATVLKLKAELLTTIITEIQRKSYSQSQLVQILDEYQPNISAMLHGKISSISVEKLLMYADRLGLKITWKISRATTRTNKCKVSHVKSLAVA